MCRRQTPGRERGGEGEREGGRERERGRGRGRGRESEKEGGGVRKAFVGVILPTMHTCMRTNTVH